MYYVNKIVGWCISPLGILFLGLLSGLVLKRWRKWLVGMTLIAFWVLGCGVTTRLIGLPLEGDETPPTNYQLPTNQLPTTIVLLGGGMGVHEKCGRAEIYGGADRAWTAARLWKRLKSKVEVENGNGPILTVSGGGARGEIAFLSDMGVDTNRIVMLDAARNTAEEAQLIKEKISSVNLNLQPPSRPRIALVTSAWHMPRARMLFERAGFEVVPVPTDYEMHCAAEHPPRFGEFFPDAESLTRNAYALKEWIARALYSVMPH